MFKENSPSKAGVIAAALSLTGASFSSANQEYESPLPEQGNAIVANDPEPSRSAGTDPLGNELVLSSDSPAVQASIDQLMAEQDAEEIMLADYCRYDFERSTCGNDAEVPRTELTSAADREFLEGVTGEAASQHEQLALHSTSPAIQESLDELVAELRGGEEIEADYCREIFTKTCSTEGELKPHTGEIENRDDSDFIESIIAKGDEPRPPVERPDELVQDLVQVNKHQA